MTVRTLGSCAACGFWRNDQSQVLAGTSAAKPLDAPGQCRRRVQTGQDGVHPLQPLTLGVVGCSEHLTLPLPERLPPSCETCRFWRRRDGQADGFCCVWAPRRASGDPEGKPTNARYAFPITPAAFFCGDGVSVHYVDPDEEAEEPVSATVTAANPLDPAALGEWNWPQDDQEGRRR